MKNKLEKRKSGKERKIFRPVDFEIFPSLNELLKNIFIKNVKIIK